jgi:hypothetical protein
MNVLDQCEPEYLRFASQLVGIFDRLLDKRSQEVLECLTISKSLRESIFQPTPSFMMDHTMTSEFMRTKDFMGTSGNFSMIYKNEGNSVNYDLNDSSMFIENLNTIHFYGENDEPIRSKKMTKHSLDINTSTYITLEAQMNSRFKER